MSSDRLAPTGERSLELLDRANTALSTDFCPWANKYVYWLKNPFWVLVLAVGGSVLCGIFLNPLVFILTAVLVTVTGAGIVLPSVAMRGIRARIVFDIPRTQVGRDAIVRLEIKNRWPLPVWGLSLIRGFALDTTSDSSEGVSLARVPGWSTVEYAWPFRPVRRGAYPNESPEVETGFPFGLFRAKKSVDVNGSLLVWPKTVRLDGMPDASESQQTEDEFSDRRAGDFGDITGTRRFRPGDSLRRVHWAQTARQQTLIVTERQAPAMSSVRVVADFSAESLPDDSPEQALELCVQATASVCESLHRQHSRVELRVGPDVFVAGSSQAGYQRLMDALAVVGMSEKAPSGTQSRSVFSIFVTPSGGYRPGHPHQVVIGDDVPGSWISIANAADLADAFPSRWRRACHA